MVPTAARASGSVCCTIALCIVQQQKRRAVALQGRYVAIVSGASVTALQQQNECPGMLQERPGSVSGAVCGYCSCRNSVCRHRRSMRWLLQQLQDSCWSRDSAQKHFRIVLWLLEQQKQCKGIVCGGRCVPLVF